MFNGRATPAELYSALKLTLSGMNSQLFSFRHVTISLAWHPIRFTSALTSRPFIVDCM